MNRPYGDVFNRTSSVGMGITAPLRWSWEDALQFLPEILLIQWLSAATSPVAAHKRTDPPELQTSK